jgi:hypothetical protein
MKQGHGQSRAQPNLHATRCPYPKAGTRSGLAQSPRKRTSLTFCMPIYGH